MDWIDQLKRLLYLATTAGERTEDPDGEDYWARYDGTMQVKVVGESHYQEALARLSGAPPDGEHGYDCMAALVLEPTNEVDPKAVMVQVGGECVGYLPRGSARRFGKRLRKMEADGVPACCMAYIGRGPDHPNLGVSLRIPYDGPLLGSG